LLNDFRGKIVSKSTDKSEAKTKFSIEYSARFFEAYDESYSRLRGTIRRLPAMKNSHRVSHGAVEASTELLVFRKKLRETVEEGSFDLPSVNDPETYEPIENRVHLTKGRWQAIFELSEEQGIAFAETFVELQYYEALSQYRWERFTRAIGFKGKTGRK